MLPFTATRLGTAPCWRDSPAHCTGDRRGGGGTEQPCFGGQAARLTETVPAFASLLVVYDPLVTDIHVGGSPARAERH